MKRAIWFGLLTAAIATCTWVVGWWMVDKWVVDRSVWGVARSTMAAAHPVRQPESGR